MLCVFSITCVVFSALTSFLPIDPLSLSATVTTRSRDGAGHAIDRTGKRKSPGGWGGWPFFWTQGLAAFRIYKDYLFRGDLRIEMGAFPGGSVAKNLPENAGDRGSIPGLGRFPHAAKLVHHDCWACSLEPGSCNYGTQVPRAHAPRQDDPPQWEAHHCSQLEMSPRSKDEDPAQAKKRKTKNQGGISDHFWVQLHNHIPGVSQTSMCIWITQGSC